VAVWQAHVDGTLKQDPLSALEKHGFAIEEAGCREALLEALLSAAGCVLARDEAGLLNRLSRMTAVVRRGDGETPAT